MSPLTVEAEIHFTRRGRGARRQIESGRKAAIARPPGRLPRVTRLMALAIRFERMIGSGEVADYAALARLGHVSRARITQIMNLLLLAPDIQEKILFLPRVTGGPDPVHLRQLQAIALQSEWRQQRQLWDALSRRYDQPKFR